MSIAFPFFVSLFLSLFVLLFVCLFLSFFPKKVHSLDQIKGVTIQKKT